MKDPDAGKPTNVALAQAIWGPLPDPALERLEELVRRYHLSVAAGELLYLQGGWYVSHSGLLGLATRKRCSGIHVEQVVDACDPTAGRWVFRAIVFKTPSSKGFVGYGDADPSNTSQVVRGAEMRVAETRAVNRALRKAYGIGLCSVEELGAPSNFSSSRNYEPPVNPPPQNGSGNGQPRLKDKLCLLIRQYNLDPTQVKAYLPTSAAPRN